MVQYRHTIAGRIPPSTGLNSIGSVKSGGGGVYFQGSSSSCISFSDNTSAGKELERVIGADMGAEAAKMALDKVVTIDRLGR